MLWEDCPRSEAVQLSRGLLVKLRPWSRTHQKLRSELSVSIGLATLDFAPKNYSAGQLIDASCRCLSSAQLSGGNTVKSIEV
jgi:hypothetical protein